MFFLWWNKLLILQVELQRKLQTDFHCFPPKLAKKINLQNSQPCLVHLLLSQLLLKAPAPRSLQWRWLSLTLSLCQSQSSIWGGASLLQAPQKLCLLVLEYQNVRQSWEKVAASWIGYVFVGARKLSFVATMEHLELSLNKSLHATALKKMLGRPSEVNSFVWLLCSWYY